MGQAILPAAGFQAGQWRTWEGPAQPGLATHKSRELSFAQGVYIAVAMALGSNKNAAIINMTPLIDVLLVLLIIFMILPHPSTGLKAEAPQPALENQPAPLNPQHLVLRIQESGSIEINSQPVLPAQLSERLQTLFAGRPDGVLFVDGAKELQFEDVANVIDIAHGVGVNRIGLLTEKHR